MDLAQLINECKGFDWDEGNILKKWEKHGVSASECEQIFFNFPLIAPPDKNHSVRETRFYVLGHTDARRYLFVVFTIRKDLIRVISARDMNRKERRIYETL